MPGIGWWELLLLGAIALIVVGPKDLPILMRTIGRYVGKARALARDFQSNFEEIAREAELDEMRKENERLRKLTQVSGPPTPAMTSAEEEALRASTNAEVLTAEANANASPSSEMQPLEPGSAAGGEPDNVTPFRGARR